jgi:hypothetical protein
MAIKQMKSQALASSDVGDLIQHYHGLEKGDAYFQCTIYNGRLRLGYTITFRRMSKREAFRHYSNLINYCNGVLKAAKDNAHKYGKVISYLPCVANPDWENIASEFEDDIGGEIMFDLSIKVPPPPPAPEPMDKPVAPQAIPKAPVQVREPISAPKPIPSFSDVKFDGSATLTTPEFYRHFISQWSKVCPAFTAWTSEKTAKGTVYHSTLPEGMVRKAIKGKFNFVVSSYRGYDNLTTRDQGVWYVYRTPGKSTIASRQTVNGQAYYNLMLAFIGKPVNGVVRVTLKVSYHKIL